MIYNSKNIDIYIDNNQYLYAQNVDISIENPHEELYYLLDRDPRATRNSSNYNASVRLSYLITGFDYLKNFIKNEKDRIQINVGGVLFTSGVLESYSLSLDQRNLLNANASLRFYNNPNGQITPTPSKQNQVNPIKWYNCMVSGSGVKNAPLTGVYSFNYNYNCDVSPRLFVSSITGQEYVITDNIRFDKKKGSLNISADNIQLQELSNLNEVVVDLYIVDDVGQVLDTLNVKGTVVSKNSRIGISDVVDNSMTVMQTNIYEPPTITAVDANITPSQYFNVEGTNFDYLTNVYIADRECYFRTISDNLIKVRPPRDIIPGAVSVYGFGGNADYDNTTFNFPDISFLGIDDVTGDNGKYVSIYGTNFDTIDKVYFGNQLADFNVYLGNEQDNIRTVVPDNFTSGFITLESTERAKTVTNSSNFRTPPKIYSFTPQTGIPGTIISITGKSFYEIVNVKMNDVITSHSVSSSSGIVITVPNGNTDGLITITTNSFTAQSSQEYLSQIVFSGIHPTSGRANLAVSISGIFNVNNLYPFDFGDGMEKYLVSFNGAITGFRYLNNGLTGEIPHSATTGPVTIFNAKGEVFYQTGYFNKLPEFININTGAINFVSPQLFVSGSRSGYYSMLSITGENFYNITGVELSGVGTYTNQYYTKKWMVVSKDFRGERYGWVNVTPYWGYATGNDNLSKVYKFGTGQITGLLSGVPGTRIFQFFNSPQIRTDINGKKLQVFLPIDLYSTTMTNVNSNVGGSLSYTGQGVYQIKVLAQDHSFVISGNTGDFPRQKQFIQIRK